MLINFISAILSALSGFIYIKSILNGESRPSFPAMIVFIVSVTVALSSGMVLGGSLAIIPGVVNVVFVVGATLLMVIKKIGHFKFSIYDTLGLSTVMAGLSIWLITNEAIIALVASTSIDAIGILLVIVKIIKDNNSESLSAWGLLSVAYLLPIIATNEITFASSFFSITNSILCGLVTVITLYQNSRYSQD